MVVQGAPVGLSFSIMKRTTGFGNVLQAKDRAEYMIISVVSVDFLMRRFA